MWETYSTASTPSLKTVINGRMNMAYFSHHLLILPFPDTATPLSLVSSAFDILSRHLSCSLLTRSSAAPMTVMMREASSAKVPSQMYSAASKVCLPAV